MEIPEREQKIQNMFFVFQITAYELEATNSYNSEVCVLTNATKISNH